MDPENISRMSSPTIDLPIPNNQFNGLFKINKKKFPSIPPEILTMVFQHLNEQDLKNVSLTCRYWKSVYDGIQIRRINFLIYALCKKKCRYVNRYIERPIKNLPDPQNLLLMRKTITRGLFQLRSHCLKIKFNKCLNIKRFEIVDYVLEYSRFLFLLFCLFKNEDISLYCFNLNFNNCLEVLELKDVFYVMSFFQNLSRLIIKETYRCIFQKEDLKSSLKLLSLINNDDWNSFHDEMFEFIILLPKNVLGPKKLISLIKNNFENKQSRYDFLKKICGKLVRKNKSFLTEIIEFLPTRSKSRAYCLAGISKGYLILGEISKSIQIAKLIRGVKLRSNLLCENIELLINMINDELKSRGYFKPKADHASFQHFTLDSSFKKKFFDLLLGLMLKIDAIPIELIKMAVEKDVILQCKYRFGFVFIIKANRKDLNLKIKSPITFKPIKDKDTYENWKFVNEKIEINIDFIDMSYGFLFTL